MKGESFFSHLRAGQSDEREHPEGVGALFDLHIMVDWSARGNPSPAKPSKDAIWWCVSSVEGVEPAEYARTRADAVRRLGDRIEIELKNDRRILVGFDFPFGYPAGVANKIAGESSALALWDWLDDQIEDDSDNSNNRFEVASKFNASYSGDGPMWGRPESFDFPLVPTKKPSACEDHPPQRRAVEVDVPRAQPIWKLFTTGSVGSQVLVGIPAVKALRRRFQERSQVWPLESGLKAPTADLVFAEIYPSLMSTRIQKEQRVGEVLDAAQVRVSAAAFAELDRKCLLEPLFSGPPNASREERSRIETEEAWILGAGYQHLFEAVPKQLRYEKDPAAIYRLSFETVRNEAKLARFPDNLRPVVTRLIHACGMVEIADRVSYSEDVVACAKDALADGAPILCDCEMVRSGIISRNLPSNNEVLCKLNEIEVQKLAARIGNTRSAAAVELWSGHLEGAIVVIGNAPTCLFHLLELLDAGWPKPAAILGFPVGFVGAAESKAELAANARGCEFLTLRGRKGGSAMASAALNALAAGLEGHG